MSTEFVATFDTAENNWEATRFVRFAGGHPGGPSFEFGHRANFQECIAIAEMGFGFDPIGMPVTDADWGTPGWFTRIDAEGRATFGKFPITVAVGSDTAARFRFRD